MARTHAFLAALLGASALVAAPAPAEAQMRQAQAAAPAQRPLSFAATPGAAGGTVVLPLAGEEDLARRGAALTDADRAAIARALTAARYEYGARAFLALRGIGAWDQILIVGMKGVNEDAGYQHAGAAVGRRLQSEPGATTVLAGGFSAQQAAEFATGFGIGEYRADLYRTREREPVASGAVTIVTDASEAGALYASRGRALVEAMAWTRDISNEPANVVYPESFVARARAAFRGVPGVTIEVLDVAAMERLGMGALLGVGQGSERPPRLLMVRYRGRGAPEGGPVVLAGKGITFDSGGISIKPSANMGSMRMDMSGAASVTGAVLALARSGAPVDVAAVAALAENMPDGGATRPGDVLTSMSGLTIEIVSTDAEGRLVLADALTWAERTLAPAAIVDVATLTGAVRTALGDDYAGLFSRHDHLADQLEAAGAATGETLWRLPLHGSYVKDTSSTYADIRNSGADGNAGAGAGAHFIGAFVSPTLPWAHLDIANVAWSEANDWKPAGSTGYAVRLLERFVRDWRPAPAE